MEIKEKYIKKYWHEIVRDQISDELKNEGYQVCSDYSIDGFTADLYAEKGEEKKIIEIKNKVLSRDKFIQLHKFATERNIKFQLAIADFRSFKPSIEVEKLESLLVNYLNDNHLYDDLGHNSYVDDITDISYNCIDIGQDVIYLRGEAVCDMLIVLDNEGDCDFNASFPMSFGVEIYTKDWKIKNSDVKVDTSSFYK